MEIKEVTDNVKKSFKGKGLYIVCGGFLLLFLISYISKSGTDTETEENVKLQSAYSSYPDVSTNADVVISSIQNAIDYQTEYQTSQFETATEYMQSAFERNQSFLESNNAAIMDGIEYLQQTNKDTSSSIISAVNSSTNSILSAVEDNNTSLNSAIATVNDNINNLSTNVNNYADMQKDFNTNLAEGYSYLRSTQEELVSSQSRLKDSIIKIGENYYTLNDANARLANLIEDVKQNQQNTLSENSSIIDLGRNNFSIHDIYSENSEPFYPVETWTKYPISMQGVSS